MTDAFVQQRQEAVVRIVIARPEVRNALTPGQLHDLAVLLARLDGDDGVRAIVLTGQGQQAFCAGLNLKDGAAIAGDLKGDGPTGLGAVLRQAQRMSTPLIGRINGACIAGGVGLATACHLTVASDDAAFGLPEIRAGLYPFVVMAALTGRVSPAVLAGLAGTGRRLSAQQACAIGLTSACVPAAELDRAVEGVLADVLAMPGDAVAALRFPYGTEPPETHDRRIADAERRTRVFWGDSNR